MDLLALYFLSAEREVPVSAMAWHGNQEVVGAGGIENKNSKNRKFHVSTILSLSPVFSLGTLLLNIVE